MSGLYDIEPIEQIGIEHCPKASEHTTCWSAKSREFLQFTSWMIKDTCWCIYWGPGSFLACISTLILQMFVLYKDSPTLPTKVLNFAELSWLFGNTCWMFADILYSTVDTNILASELPLSHVDEELYKHIVICSLCFFSLGIIPSATYLIHTLSMRRKWSSIGESEAEIGIIFFWLCKDICWCYFNVWTDALNYLAIFCGICAALIAICLIYVAHGKFEKSHNFMHFCWIMGNLLWMTSEFKENDKIKIAALVFFGTGQFIILCCSFYLVKNCYLRSRYQFADDFQKDELVDITNNDLNLDTFLLDDPLPATGRPIPIDIVG